MLGVPPAVLGESWGRSSLQVCRECHGWQTTEDCRVLVWKSGCGEEKKECTKALSTRLSQGVREAAKR